jgi:hypothetical protein
VSIAPTYPLAGPDVALHPQGGEVRAGLLEGGVGEDAQKADRLTPGPAGETYPAQDGDFAIVLGDPDPAREEHQERRGLEESPRAELEYPGVLEEELASLGKKEVEAGQVDDLVVGLHLGEVGVQGAVENDPGVHLPLGVQADAGVALGGDLPVVLALPVHSDQPVRLHLQVETGAGQAGEAHQVAGLADPVQASLPAGPSAPERLLVLASDHPLDVESPGLLVGPGRIAQAAERDGEFGRPSFVRGPGRHLPDPSPIRVKGGAFVGDQAVELGPVRVGGEDEGVAVVVEGVEDDRDRVVSGDPGAVV